MTNRSRSLVAAAILATGLLVPIASERTEAAFQTNRAGNYEIYAMNPDGTTPTRLTTNTAWDGPPAYSSDGKKLVFSTDRDLGPDREELYTMGVHDADNATADYDPDWGPVVPPPGCTVVGTAGEDVISASQSPGDDTICTLVGGSGSDKVYGEAGADTLNVKDGVKGNDLADGGSGTDTCTSDRKDKLMSCP